MIVKGNHAKKQAITLIKLVILLQLKKGWTFDFYLGHFTFLKSQMQESFSKNPLLIFFSINTCSQMLCGVIIKLKMTHNYIFIAFLCDNFSQSKKYSNSNLFYPSIGKTCFFSMPKNFFCILRNAKSTTFRHTRQNIKSFQ